MEIDCGNNLGMPGRAQNPLTHVSMVVHFPPSLLSCSGAGGGADGNWRFTRGGVCQVSRAEKAKTKGLKMNAKKTPKYINEIPAK